MEKTKNVGMCEFCNKLKVNQTYFVYRLDFLTNKSDYNIGIVPLSEELGMWLMNKGVHLSSTQVILLRPDITLQYLREKYDTLDETVLVYNLVEAEICYECFRDYKEEVLAK